MSVSKKKETNMSDYEHVDPIIQKQRRKKRLGRLIRNSILGACQGSIVGAIVIVFYFIYQKQQHHIQHSKIWHSIQNVVHLQNDHNDTVNENHNFDKVLEPEVGCALVGLILFVSLQLFSGKYAFDVIIQSFLSSFIACNMVWIGMGENGKIDIWKWELGALILSFSLFILVNIVRKVNCCTLIPLILLILSPLFVWAIAY